MRTTPSISQNSVEECSCELIRLTSPTGATKNRPTANANEIDERAGPRRARELLAALALAVAEPGRWRRC